MPKRPVLTVAAIASAALCLSVTPLTAEAAKITGKEAKEFCARGDVGPLTPYGETPAEAAAKRIVFAWNCGTMVQRDAKAAFEKYVSKEWCDFGHLINQMKKMCGTFEEATAMFSRMGGGKPLTDDEIIEFPTMASVNGPMVTMYGAGVDIFEVRDGKIVAHYDASPMKAIAFADKKPENLPPWVPGSTRGSGPGPGGPPASSAAPAPPGPPASPRVQ